MMQDRRDGSRRPRRCRTEAEKVQIVAETLSGATSVSVVARRHDVNANQVFKWRRQYRRGELTHQAGSSKTPNDGAGLVAVGVIRDGGRVCSLAEPYTTRAPAPQGKSPSCESSGQRPALIEFDLRSGTRIRIDAGVDPGVLQQVLTLIERLA